MYHNKPGRFCSRKCANSRVWTEDDRIKKSIAAKKSKKVLAANIINQPLAVAAKANKPRIEPARHPSICIECGKTHFVRGYQLKRRKFCCGTCRNKYNNKFIKGSRSKAEILLEKTLLETFPDLNILFNDRLVLDGLELDVYIPQLKIAIEWNGIFHYRSTKGSVLEQYIKKDELKQERCKKLNINLLVVKDMTSNPKYVKSEIDNLVKTISIYHGSSTGRAANSKSAG